MSTWRVASAALFGEADLNMKKGRTPSTKVQGIRGLKSSGTQYESSGESFLKDSGEKAERAWESTKESAKDTGEKVERAWESTKESVSDAFTSAGEAISDKFRDLTGQKSAQEKAGDKAGEAVEHLKETGQSVKKGLENAAEAVSDKFKES
jgi:archaellum component FlaC